MVETPIVLADNAPTADIEQRAEQVCLDAGLYIARKTTLASYPGSVHWHWKQAGTPGVLELTWWPQRRRLWFAVHANRKAPWIELLMNDLEPKLAIAVNTSPQVY
jgi:hypothetical protein